MAGSESHKRDPGDLPAAAGCGAGADHRPHPGGCAPRHQYQLANRGLAYIRRGDTVWEEVDVLQQAYSTASGQLACTRFLYHNACPVGYTLPPETPIIDEKERPS